ncbi:MAG: sialidase family protein [Terriglobales bacterium]
MRSVYIGLVLLATIGVLAEAQEVQPPRLIVGPNILVSHDRDVSHMETMIVSSPVSPKTLLGASITMTGANGGFANKAYVSDDGGYTWSDIAFPADAANGSLDPQVGFGLHGSMYYAGIYGQIGINIYRSEDGGRVWGKPFNLGRGDHEMLVTDTTYGPFAGRVYVANEANIPGSPGNEALRMDQRVVLFRSVDDGRSFIGPVEVARSNNYGLEVVNPLVLSDGTLFVPMFEFPNYLIDKKTDVWKAVFSISHDGGVTFSPLRPIANIPWGGEPVMRANQRSGHVDQIGAPEFAVDREGRFRDRIYAAWSEYDNGRYRLMLTWSSDRGNSWIKPKPVDPDEPPDASQFQPMVAVDPTGNLGLLWYDTDGFPKRDQFSVWFTASLDGGETFLPKRRLSTEPSNPFGSGDLRPGPWDVHSEHGLINVDFASAVSRWIDGGDYIGMTADMDGLFHPFWADARSGTYQLYTARVRVAVGQPGTMAAENPEGFVHPFGSQPSSLSTKVTLVFDPINYDRQSRELVVPIRLKNISDETLYPPFRVEIKEFAYPFMIKAHEPIDAPTVLNSSNGKDGVGAVFDYSKALGDLQSLSPGAVTDALPWRLRTTSPVKTQIHLGVEITGFTSEGRQSSGANAQSK